VKIDAGPEAIDLNVHVAQGSNTAGNNWWIGGTAIANPGTGPVVIPIVTYDCLRNETVTRQVFEVVFVDKNNIQFRAWF
jgi:hypothetical protein